MRPALADVPEAGVPVRRVTFPQTLGSDHVHCYLLRGATGWTLVDVGLDVPGIEAAWRDVVAGLDAPLERVVVTHLHVDHAGGAAAAAAACDGPVLQGRLDRDQAMAAYLDDGWPGSLRDHVVAHGMPAGEAAAVERTWRAMAALVRLAPAEPLDAGDRVDGWEVLALPGHADGHIGLLRDGVLVGGDVLLDGVSPTIGAYPGCHPDPLGLYLETLGRIVGLAPDLVLPGHGEPIADPAARAREIAVHHRDRLGAAAGALGPRPRSAYEVSRALWPSDLDPGQRSFAVAEALAHLERLVRDGRAEAVSQGGRREFRRPAAER